MRASALREGKAEISFRSTGCGVIGVSNTGPFLEQEIDHGDGQDLDDDLALRLAGQRIGTGVVLDDRLVVRGLGVLHRGSPFERPGGETRVDGRNWDSLPRSARSGLTSRPSVFSV